MLKAEPPSSGRAFDSYAFSVLQELKILHRSACEKHLSPLDVFLLIAIPQNRSSSLPVKKMYLNTTSLFSLDAAGKKRLLTAQAKVRAQRVVGSVPKHFAPGKEQASPVPVAEKCYLF